ncbi:OB-fold nucleic acid binding domain-containing protein [Varibaculum vaginae]|uniref:OB-fold nucleic acid binding domain-containing protein n=1 Tax=Varibaculum vaginae TaxID=2364797 RepID=UPI000F08517A|nr:OB-fold nucleic acid binding domain-containing protein [Varibaculum vaginae]
MNSEMATTGGQASKVMPATNAKVPVASKVCDVAERQKASLYGVLRSVTFPPRTAAGSFTATLFDGTGSIEVLWLGRKSVPGIKAGIRLAVQGMVISRSNGLCVINPTFQIEPVIADEH